ncbi:MAG: hypothetical protein KAG53_03565 [Endozoicomonadaceae bacterium]|nr:hypothetical protein [Endozoicomonadaceae bacterium]
MKNYICNTCPNNMQETISCRSKSDTDDKKLPFNGRGVKSSSSLSFDVTNRESDSTSVSTVRGGRYRGHFDCRELRPIESCCVVLRPKKKATSTINKSDKSSVQSSSGIDRADYHSSTNKYESSSSKSESKQIHNTDNLFHPDKNNDNSLDMNKSDEPDSSMEKPEYKQNLSRVHMDNSKDDFNFDLSLTECEYSYCKDEVGVFEGWLERVKAVNDQSTIIQSYGMKELHLITELQKINIARSDRMKVIESLNCWTERFQFYDLDSLMTIFYKLVKGNIFLWRQHAMTYDEIEFMKILLSTLISKYEVSDCVIAFLLLSNTLSAVAVLADKSDFLLEHINEIIPKLLMLIFTCKIEASEHQYVPPALLAVVKLVSNDMVSIKIEDENIINIVTKLLLDVTKSGKDFDWLSLGTLMMCIGKLMQMKIKNKHCIMNAFNALLPVVVPLARTSGKPCGFCSVLFAIVQIMKNKKDDMKIPDSINITKDIINPVICCVNKYAGHLFTTLDVNIMLFYISSLYEMDLVKIGKIFEPIVLLITLIPILEKKWPSNSMSIGLMMLSVGKITI